MKFHQDTFRWLMIIMVAVAIIIYSQYDQLEEDRLLSGSQQYYVATIIDVYQPARGGEVVKYEYNVDGKVYKGETTNGDDMGANIGDIYLISVPHEVYPQGIILRKYKLNPNIKAPLFGWDTILKEIRTR